MSSSIKTLSRPKAPVSQKWGVERNRNVYGSNRWKKTSERWRMNNPLCVVCEEPGQLTDHIEPIAMGGAVWDENNFQTLCNRCHRIKTRGER